MTLDTKSFWWFVERGQVAAEASGEAGEELMLHDQETCLAKRQCESNLACESILKLTSNTT